MMKLLKILRQAQDKQNGFTLVELLIVIALIAILSVAVLATINPIEQSNKARDAKFKNDAAEVLNAYERYYASQNNYPWNGATGENKALEGQANIAFVSTDFRFGVLTEDNDNGLLISTSELKSSFAGKEPFVFDGDSEVDLESNNAMYVFNGDSTYVCFCPKAKANRVDTVGASLKCLRDVNIKNGELSNNAKLFDVGTDTCVQAASPTDVNSPNFCNLDDTDHVYANMMCVPEGRTGEAAAPTPATPATPETPATP